MNSLWNWEPVDLLKTGGDERVLVMMRASFEPSIWRVTVINMGGDETVNKDGGSMGAGSDTHSTNRFHKFSCSQKSLGSWV